MSDKERPAEPAADDDGTARGGFAEVARELNRLYPVRRRPISRQLVHKWWINRNFNSFPNAVESKGTGNGGRGRPVFDLADVAEWYASYRRHRGAHDVAQTGQTQRITVSEPPTADGDTMAA